ncbi:Protein of unknown function DUF401 [Moorella glycerini]|uniref:Uncharacterized protein n=1 Tax=Neomoorella stamsii TaxID=1266720 RepID=A0A9X7J4H5_9FIRM|nr:MULTISPECIES: DUF401 family protein [Moorella]PRR74613.1 hypothetical protein MOST_10480 [Moorella stamsii]CEP69100.1 Protein of unknown function DUF401 [Moorella glycerini]
MFGFLVGLITGTVSYSMGIIFPVVVAATGGQIEMPLVVFVFVATFTGAMFIPMHLCLTLTVDFFKGGVASKTTSALSPPSLLFF